MDKTTLQRHLVTDHHQDPMQVTGVLFGRQVLPVPTETDLQTMHDALPHHVHGSEN